MNLQDSCKKFLKGFGPIKISSTICSQIIVFLLVSKFSPAEYGGLVLYITASQLIYITTTGWNGGILLNLSVERYSKTQSYSDLLLYRVVLIAICSIIFIIVSYIANNLFKIILFSNLDLSLVILLYVGYILNDFGNQLLYPAHLDKLQSIIEFFGNLIILSTIYFFAVSIIDYILIFVFGSAIIFSISSYQYYLNVKKINIPTFTGFKKSASYSIWQILSLASIYALNYGLNYYFASLDISNTDIGIFNFGFKLFMGYSIVFSLFAIIVPKLMCDPDSAKFRSIYSLKILGWSTLLGLLYLAMYPLISVITNFIGHGLYSDSSQIYLYLAPAFFLYAYVNLHNAVFCNSEIYKLGQLAMLMPAILIALLGWPLINFFGIYGAVLSLTIGLLGGAFCMRMVARRHSVL